jgi:hypothetical protein
MITVGLIAGEIAAYIFIVKKFPILQGHRHKVPKMVPLGDDVLRQFPIPSAAPAGAD